MTHDPKRGTSPDGETMAALQKGAEAFNSGKFFECHEILEEIWRGCHDPWRGLLQGLIQISVGFYHLRNHNLPGGESQLSKGLANLEPYGDRYAGVELADLRQEVRNWIHKIRHNEELKNNLPKYVLTGTEHSSR